MRYDLKHSRDLGTPQPVEEAMGPPEPATSPRNGRGRKTGRVVRGWNPKEAKPTKEVESLSPAKFKQYMSQIAELERHRKITSKTARKLRASLHKQVPRSPKST
jgi:hypothetical protein